MMADARTRLDGADALVQAQGAALSSTPQAFQKTYTKRQEARKWGASHSHPIKATTHDEEADANAKARRAQG